MKDTTGERRGGLIRLECGIKKVPRRKEKKTKIQPETFFSKPCGPAEIIRHGPQMGGTTSRVICGFCGAAQVERELSDDNHHVAVLLGRQLVMECCGRVLDVLYQELKDIFTDQKIEEFRRHPLNEEFSYFRFQLREAVESWANASEAQLLEGKKTQARLPA